MTNYAVTEILKIAITVILIDKVRYPLRARSDIILQTE